jgi:hypothetical protein
MTPQTRHCLLLGTRLVAGIGEMPSSIKRCRIMILVNSVESPYRCSIYGTQRVDCGAELSWMQYIT